MEPDLRNPDEVHADLYRQISSLNRWLMRLSVFMALTSLAVLLLVLTGCTPKEDSHPAPNAPESANAVTEHVCDETVKAYLGDTIATAEGKQHLLDLAKTASVNGTVRSSIVDGLYAGDGMPIGDQITNRYNLVLSACRRAGWQG